MTTGFWVMDYLCLAALVTAAFLVVKLRNLNGAVMALSALGAVLALAFDVLAAPDLANAEIIVGAIAVPVLYLIAIGKIRTDVLDRGDLGEEDSDQDQE